MKNMWFRIKWYHYNEFSNPFSKGLWFFNILLGLYAVSVGESFGIWVSLFAYVCLLCTRGFGEPTLGA